MLLTAADLLMASNEQRLSDRKSGEQGSVVLQTAGRKTVRAFVLCFVPHVSGRVHRTRAPFSQVAVVTILLFQGAYLCFDFVQVD